MEFNWEMSFWWRVDGAATWDVKDTNARLAQRNFSFNYHNLSKLSTLCDVYDTCVVDVGQSHLIIVHIEAANDSRRPEQGVHKKCIEILQKLFSALFLGFSSLNNHFIVVLTELLLLLLSQTDAYPLAIYNFLI